MLIHDYECFIDGHPARGEGEPFEVQNPADESIVAECIGVSGAQVVAAIEAARRAYDDGRWSGLPARERAERLRRFLGTLAGFQQAITDLVVREAGCPRHSGPMAAQVAAPLRMGGETIDLFLTLPEFEENPLPLHERVNPMGQVVQSLRRYTPIGVVSAIAAYNFPFYTAMWKVVPALVAGNTVVLRPSPLTPLSALLLASAAIEAELPPGVLNIVTEGGLAGGMLLTTHPAVDMVAFTGSSAVGMQIMMQAASTMKRLQLELGGKSAQIFLPDATDKAALAAMIVCTAHAGQGCALGTRLFVPEDRKREVLEHTAALFAKLKIGHTEDPETQVGPVISAAQRARCEHFVKSAIEQGGRVVTGGKRPTHLEQGFYFEPTVLDVPDNANPAAQEEIFGPVATVIGYRDLDHAVAMANDSRFGLSGYVHGEDKAESLRVALQIKSGTVQVNGAVMSAYASSGGQRLSGIGRERGIEGLRLYQQLSCLTLGA